MSIIRIKKNSIYLQEKEKLSENLSFFVENKSEQQIVHSDFATSTLKGSSLELGKYDIYIDSFRRASNILDRG